MASLLASFKMQQELLKKTAAKQAATIALPIELPANEIAFRLDRI